MAFRLALFAIGVRLIWVVGALITSGTLPDKLVIGFFWSSDDGAIVDTVLVMTIRFGFGLVVVMLLGFITIDCGCC